MLSQVGWLRGGANQPTHRYLSPVEVSENCVDSCVNGFWTHQQTADPVEHSGGNVGDIPGAIRVVVKLRAWETAEETS